MPTDALPDDLDAMRSLVHRLASERDAALAENRRLTDQNDQLRHLLARLRRAQFGRRSERLDPEQMQLALEDVETTLAARDAQTDKKQDRPAEQRKRRINRGRAAGAPAAHPCHAWRPRAPYARAATAGCT